MSTILEKMQKICAEKHFYPTANIEKIAKAKARMFGEEEWYRCPCDGNNPLRSCISELCQSEIKRDGICHCTCYTNKKPE